MRRRLSLIGATALAAILAGFPSACAPDVAPGSSTEAQDSGAVPSAAAPSAMATPGLWPEIAPLPLDPAIEARIDEILALMTVEQKVGQVIQADSESVTPDDVRRYRLGSVLSGGNAAPGPLPWADTQVWLESGDAYFNASIDPEGVEIAIPIIYGIDAVHGHTNLLGATVFPHNIGLGAANDPDLIEEIYRATALELAVSGHDWTFAPTLAVPRDDRWGRAYEGFSESPDITAAYAPRIVTGLQGGFGTEEFLSQGHVISSAKHFLADGGTEGGRDQGDALISETELRDIHAPGYFTAIPAGVQTVMASFSAWNGMRMHGNESLLTDVLKERMGFNGFVIGDWNGHALIDGCTSTDCPASFNAGVDMFMAPDSWRGLYESTLGHVRSGVISQERLDDAVRRILRVKLAYGVFDLPAPSARPLAGDTSILARPEHREIARRAVRQSLVLLKNEAGTLPLDPSLTILVVGPGADSISKAAGGWTLSWQGGGLSNDLFPNAQTILDGIREAATAAGGAVIYDPEGASAVDADVVIAVYGEDPYAEFQGDRDHVDFEPNDFDTARLADYRERGMPVVSVFLSGRPLWTNPEINASDAFVAAWLPGSEGGGVADMLFRTDPSYEFTGRLSFSWPARADQATINVGDPSYAPLFAYGAGLSYSDTLSLEALPEESGLAPVSDSVSTLFSKGRASEGLVLAPIHAGEPGLSTLGRTDRTSQEDSIHLRVGAVGDGFALTADTTLDVSEAAEAGLALTFRARAFWSEPFPVEIGLGCAEGGTCLATVPVDIRQGPWGEYAISLHCFAEAGADLGAVDQPFLLRALGASAELGVGDIAIAPAPADLSATCGN